MGTKILNLHDVKKPRVCNLERDEEGRPYLEFKKSKDKYARLYLSDLQYQLQMAKVNKNENIF